MSGSSGSTLYRRRRLAISSSSRPLRLSPLPPPSILHAKDKTPTVHCLQRPSRPLCRLGGGQPPHQVVFFRRPSSTDPRRSRAPLLVRLAHLLPRLITDRFRQSGSCQARYQSRWPRLLPLGLGNLPSPLGVSRLREGFRSRRGRRRLQGVAVMRCAFTSFSSMNFCPARSVRRKRRNRSHCSNRTN
jgi:hypothetical protein